MESEKDGKFFYVFFDPNKKLEVHNHVVDKTCQKLGIIQSRKRYKSLPESSLVIVEPKEKDEEGRDFIAYENLEGIQKAQDKAGWFILCSSLEMTPQEAYEAYKGRAAGTGIEGTFRTLKSFVDGRVMRTHNEKTTRGKDFVLTIATILRRGMEYLFKPVLFKLGRKSLPKAIKELDQYKVQNYRGRVRPVQAMTRLQKELMKTLGLKEEDIVGKIVRIESWTV